MNLFGVLIVHSSSMAVMMLRSIFSWMVSDSVDVSMCLAGVRGSVVAHADVTVPFTWDTPSGALSFSLVNLFSEMPPSVTPVSDWSPDGLGRLSVSSMNPRLADTPVGLSSRSKRITTLWRSSMATTGNGRKNVSLSSWISSSVMDWFMICSGIWSNLNMRAWRRYGIICGMDRSAMRHNLSNSGAGFMLSCVSR